MQVDRLSIPVHAKWVRPFFLSWFDSSIARVRPGLPSLAFHRQIEQAEENVSVDRDSSYHAYPYLLFPNDPVLPLLSHIGSIQDRF